MRRGLSYKTVLHLNQIVKQQQKNTFLIKHTAKFQTQKIKFKFAYPKKNMFKKTHKQFNKLNRFLSQFYNSFLKKHHHILTFFLVFQTSFPYVSTFLLCQYFNSGHLIKKSLILYFFYQNFLQITHVGR